MDKLVEPSAQFIGAHLDLLAAITRLKLIAKLAPTLSLHQKARLLRGMTDLTRGAIITHHADEEQILFPDVLQRAREVGKIRSTKSLLRRLTLEHRAIEMAWWQLEPAVRSLENLQDCDLSIETIDRLLSLCSQHTCYEEAMLLPLANHFLADSNKVMQDLNRRLQYHATDQRAYI